MSRLSTPRGARVFLCAAVAGIAGCTQPRELALAPIPWVEQPIVVFDDSRLPTLKADVQRQLALAMAGTLVLSLAAAGAAGRLATVRPLLALSTRTARLEASGDAARKVNHDIKNGLTPIRNVLRHLAQVADGQPTALAALFAERRRTLESGVAYLDNLARNSLALPPPAHGPTDARAVVMDVAGGVTDALVGVRMPATLPLVRMDAVALRRVMDNIVTNAVESFEGRFGTITIAADVIGIAPNLRVRIQVIDMGRGMGRAELARAFDDHFSTKPQGTGLGLSTVRRLLADVGGSVRADSTPDEGTTFTIEIPAAESVGHTHP